MEYRKRKEVEAPGKDSQETRAEGTPDGKESQKNGGQAKDQAKTDAKAKGKGKRQTQKGKGKGSRQGQIAI